MFPQDNADRAKRQALQSIDANIPLPAKPATPVAKKPELYNLKKNSGYTYQSILADRGSVPLIHPGVGCEPSFANNENLKFLQSVIQSYHSKSVMSLPLFNCS